MEQQRTIPHRAVLAACTELMRACGLMLAELSKLTDELGTPAPSVPPLNILPMAGEVNIDAVHMRQPAPTVETKARALTHNDRLVIDAADSPEGTTVNGVMELLGLQEAQAHRICSLLADSHHLIRVKKPGIRAMHFFSSPASAQAWANDTAGDAAPFPNLAEHCPNVVALSADELRSIRIHAAKVAGSKKVPAPMGARTPHKPKPLPHQNVTFSPPTIDDTVMRPKGEPVITNKTRVTLDTVERPTAKWQTQQLPPDPRYPSFSSMRPGVNPDTGKEWEQRA